MEARLTAVTLGVTDIGASRRFYKEGLGLEPVSEVGDEVSFFNLAPGVVLALYSDLADDARVTGRGAGLTALAHNVLERTDVDDLIALAKSAGATVTRPAHDTDWGGRSGYFTDPDGHLWEIAWNPFWVTDANGGTRVPPPET